MVALINRATITKELLPGLNKIVGLQYKDVADEHKPLFDTETSERSFEEEVMYSLFGTAPSKSEGAAVTFDASQETFSARYNHVTYALAFAITEEAMEDNLYDTFAKVRAKALGRAMGNTKQVVAANVLNNGFSSSFPGGDGVSLFSASHPTIAGLQSNLLSGDLSEAALENAAITISLEKDERGILTGDMADSLHIPPQLQFLAHRILKSDKRQGTADNDANALRDGNFYKGIHINRRFTDPDAWFVRTANPDGLKHFERVKLQTKMENDFHTGNIMYKARERYSFGWTDFRGVYGSPGA